MRRSAQVWTRLTLVISFRNHWFRLIPGLGIADDRRTYKEGHNKRRHAIRVLHRQWRRAIHVAK